MCHSQNVRIYNNADIVSVVIMQGVTQFQNNPHDMRMRIKEIIYESDYIWKCSYNYLNFLNSHSEKIILKYMHYTIALHIYGRG